MKAHAVAVLGENGEGLNTALRLENEDICKTLTFGKGFVLPRCSYIRFSEDLKDYLVKFRQTFIYTTALTPHTFGKL